MRMRNLITYIFIFVYFVLSIGITANVHFCCGRVHSVSFYQGHNVNSCCGKLITKKGCCENAKVTIKLSSVEKIQAVALTPLIFETIAPEADRHYFLVAPKIIEKKVIPRIFPPPNTSYPSIFCKNCILII